VCSTVPILAWRRAPRVVFVVTAGADVLLAALGYSLGLAPGPTVALYLWAASRTEGDPWSQRDTVIAAGLFLADLGAAGLGEGSFPWSTLLHTGLGWAVAWFAGERTRLRREKIAELEERARRTEHDAERERMLAAAEERARIARDLHDSAGHAISVIAVRAGAARMRYREDPDRSLAALKEVEELARQTAGEIDKIVGTLREGDVPDDLVEAPLGLASVDSLITRHAAAGLQITFEASGAPRPLAAAQDQAVYRILQEALTNAARYGGGSARIELAYEDAGVELSVTNPVAADGPRRGGGHGLVGMRERATLLGGSIAAEPSNGEFRVHARIPYGGDET
jgi:signal transduction histidine kinase